MFLIKNKKIPKPLVLVILDGLGVAPDSPGNAVKQANTPNLDQFWSKYRHSYLQASGNYVGLPKGVVGNSEVGHLSIGAGRIVFQEIAKIDDDIEKGYFFSNEIFKKAIEHAKKNQGKLHLMGLTSNGKVHSSIDHLFACIEFCKKEGLKKEQLLIHAFTDGRDTPQKSAIDDLERVEAKCNSIGIGRIVTIIGRYFAMDRDDRWERTKEAYNLIVEANGKKFKKIKDAIEFYYNDGITDEYIKPSIIEEDEEEYEGVEEGDSVVFFNYRADRAVQLSKAFVEKDFEGWEREKIKNLFFAGFSNYEKGIPVTRLDGSADELPQNESLMVKNLFKEELKKSLKGFPENQIFPPEKVEYSLGRLISDSGLSQLRITESEKFPHVTYFFNCRFKDAFPREDRIEIPSPKDIPTYDLKPEMSAFEVTDKLIGIIEQNPNKYDFILINYALTDMVAHTGNLKASIKAVEVADECLGKLSKTVLNKGGELIVIADHGNIEEMINLQTGEVDTQHSTNLVPFLYITNDTSSHGVEGSIGMLADVAPTVLSILNIELHDSMTGRNLLA